MLRQYANLKWDVVVRAVVIRMLNNDIAACDALCESLSATIKACV